MEKDANKAQADAEGEAVVAHKLRAGAAIAVQRAVTTPRRFDNLLMAGWLKQAKLLFMSTRQQLGPAPEGAGGLRAGCQTSSTVTGSACPDAFARGLQCCFGSARFAAI